MAKGGARVGTGPKGKASLRVVTAEDGPDVRVPPDDLPADQAAVWRRLAPLAIEAGTLVGRTVPGFRLLCKLTVMETSMAAVLADERWTFAKVTIDGAGQEQQEIKAHPLCTHHKGLAQRIESLMGRYAIVPFGKPVGDPPKRKTVAQNPWEGIATR